MGHSQETRRKMSEAKIKFFANGGMPWNKMETKEALKKCHKCGNEFIIHARNRINTAKFCSILCAKGHNVFDKGNIPWNKGRPHLRGDRHPNWKGGIDKEHTRIKQTKEYKDWRNSVYKKYEWTCQHCGYRGKNIVAHHIKLFSKYPELRFDVNNGIVVCRRCHQLIHKPRRSNYHSEFK